MFDLSINLHPQRWGIAQQLDVVPKEGLKNEKTVSIPLLLPCLVALPMFAQKEAAARLTAATDVLNEIMATPDKGIPQDLLDKAACVIVVPNLKKAGFVVGAKYGRGFFSCRKTSGVGWSAPASVRVEGGSFGFLIGVPRPM